MATPMDVNMLELLTSTDAETACVAQTLVTIGSCPRCVLRYLGEKRPFVYKAQAKELCELVRQLIGDDVIGYCESGTPPCPICLGILEEFCSIEFLKQVKEGVEKEGFQFSNYQCSLMLPVSNILREHSLLLHLKKSFDSMYNDISEDTIPSVKDVWKWYSGPELSQLLNSEFQLKSQFDISVTFTHRDSEKECNFLLDVQPHIFRRRKMKKFGFETFTRANVAKALKDISNSKFEEYYTCPPSCPASKCEHRLECSHDAVFIAGRYNKYSRTLSQTPWFVDGERKSESSVQELICQVILDRFKPTDHKLSSSGREDVDVRMLGTGRPFVVELVNPHAVQFTQEEMTAMQEQRYNIDMDSNLELLSRFSAHKDLETNKLTDEVAISDLQMISREETSKLKEGEIEKTKSYSALCWSKEEISTEKLDTLKQTKDLKLDQKTPIRVLHRRPLASRERVIHELHAEKIDKHHFKLYLSTQAGTYIKEFVHGDFGRTTPNLSTLMGVECDILELDVEAVNVDWPPRLA